MKLIINIEACGRLEFWLISLTMVAFIIMMIAMICLDTLVKNGCNKRMLPSVSYIFDPDAYKYPGDIIRYIFLYSLAFLVSGFFIMWFGAAYNLVGCIE